MGTSERTTRCFCAVGESSYEKPATLSLAGVSVRVEASRNRKKGGAGFRSCLAVRWKRGGMSPLQCCGGLNLKKKTLDLKLGVNRELFDDGTSTRHAECCKA